MAKEIVKITGNHVSPFERIKRTNDASNEYWESRDLAEVLENRQYRNFESVIERAKLACFNNGRHLEDHFVGVTDMIEIGSGAGAKLFRYPDTTGQEHCSGFNPSDLTALGQEQEMDNDK